MVGALTNQCVQTAPCIVSILHHSLWVDAGEKVAAEQHHLLQLPHVGKHHQYQVQLRVVGQHLLPQRRGLVQGGMPTGES